MKKVSALLLTTMLGSSMVFASFTGSATLSTGFDFDSKDSGMANSSSATFDIDLLNVTNEDVTSDKAVWADIEASLKVGLMSSDMEDGIDFDDDAMVLTLVSGDQTSRQGTGAILGAALSLDSATVNGDGWSLDITGVTGNPDYAVSAIDSNSVEGEIDDWGFVSEDYDDYFDYEAGYNDGVAGFSLTYGISTLGLGFEHTDGVGTDLTVYVGGDDYQLAEGLMFSGAVAYSQEEVTTTSQNLLGSLELAFTAEDYSATLASDFGYDMDAEEAGADVALNAMYSAFTLDAYYATTAEAVNGDDYTVTDSIDDLLSLQVEADLSSMMDMPLTLTLAGLDLVNAQELSAEAAYDLTDMLTLTLSGSYTLDDDSWDATIEAEYTTDMYYVDASATIETDNAVSLYAYIESTTIVDNATLYVEWDNSADLLNQNSSQAFGDITAACEIDF
jgi:hypothetical protein